MTPEQKQQIVEMMSSAMDQHEKYYAEQDSDYELMPMYFLHKGTAIHTVAAVPEIGGPAKDFLIAKVGEAARWDGCDGYTFSMEAWTLPPEETKNHVPGTSMAGNPKRLEIISVEAGTAAGHGVLVADIDRSGPHVRLTRRDVMIDGEDGAGLHSRFNIFAPHPGGVQLDAARRTTWG